MVFLGVLLDGESWSLVIPDDKKQKALDLLRWTVKTKKVTIHFVQQLTGTLNFLCKVIVSGRTFMRRMYDKLKLTNSHGEPLKKHHHITLDQGSLKDCKMWQIFLESASIHPALSTFH